MRSAEPSAHPCASPTAPQGPASGTVQAGGQAARPNQALQQTAAGMTVFRAMKSLQPAPLLNFIVRLGRRKPRAATTEAAMVTVVSVLFILAGLGTLIGTLGGRPSAVHDPKGYDDAVKAPGVWCLLIVIGVAILWLGGGLK